MKEIKLRPFTELKDLQTKAKKINEFIEKKERVKISVRFKGRQHQHMDVTGPEVLDKILYLVDKYKVVNPMKNTGRQYVIVIE